MTEDVPKYDSELVIFYSLSLPSSTPHPCATQACLKLVTLLLQLPDIGLACPFYFYLGVWGGECSVCKAQKRASEPWSWNYWHL